MGSSCAEDSADRKVLFVGRCFLGMLGYRTEMSERRMNPGNGTMMAELVLLFVGFPVLFRLLPVRLSPLPALWLAALYCIYVLRRGSGPNTMGLWNAGPLADSIGSVLGVFAVAAIIITVAVWRLRPQILFGFVRNSPQFWALVMVLYPVLSVYPQGIIYRGFFFERYQSLFRSPADMILASAAAFAFSHVIFRVPGRWRLLSPGACSFLALPCDRLAARVLYSACVVRLFHFHRRLGRAFLSRCGPHRTSPDYS